MTNEERVHDLKSFKKKAFKLFKKKFDYSKTIYIHSHTPIEIICPQHGSFFQKPVNHFSNTGCPKCSLSQRKNQKVKIVDTNSFIKESKIKFKIKFDYSRTIYKNIRTELEIICPQHGSFFQLPGVHIVSTTGCTKCSIEERKKQLTGRKIPREFVEKRRTTFLSHDHPMSEEYHKKRSEISKNNWKNPNYAIKRRETLKKNGHIVDISKLPDFLKYEKRIDILTAQNFKKYQNYINPTNLKRSRYDFHLDHKISKSYGFQNNILPYIISHPCNLELILSKENWKKRNNCSQTLKQLINKIENFKEMYDK